MTLVFFLPYYCTIKIIIIIIILPLLPSHKSLHFAYKNRLLTAQPTLSAVTKVLV